MDKNNWEMLPPPFQVRTAGRVAENPYHSTPGTKDGDIMLTVFLAGKGIYQNSEGRREITAGTAGLVPPEDAGVLASHPQHPYCHYYCRFSGDYARQMAHRILAEKNDRFFRISEIDVISGLLQKISRCALRDLPEQMGRREVLLADILVVLRGQESEVSSPRLDAHAIDSYLEETIAEPTDLERMADFFGISKATLCRRVKQCTGETVQRLHEKKKVTRAQQLLQLGGFSVREVSFRTGYADPLYFSRVYKKHIGRMPSAEKPKQS